MRSYLFILFACLLAGFASCTKDNSLASVNGSSATSYTLTKGSVTINTPDTTYTFTLPSDQVYFSAGATYFNLVCYRDNLTSFNITSTDKVAANSTLGIYEFHFYGLYKNTSQVYTNTTATNIGTISIVDLNTNGTGISGTFTASIPRANNGSQTNTQPYTITGNFNLN